MQRFLAIGKARLHVLEAGVHDPKEAQRIAATLTALRPSRLWFDLSGPEWIAIAQGRRPGKFAKRVVAVAKRSNGPVDPDIVYRAAKAWADEHGVPVKFLLDEADAPHWLDLWRLDRLLQREGFEAADATAAARRLHLHYVSRLPGLLTWLDRRWTQAARRLAAAEREAGAGGLVVCAVPDGEGIADRVQHGPKA